MREGASVPEAELSDFLATWRRPSRTTSAAFEAPTKFSGLFTGFTVSLAPPLFATLGDGRGSEALDREAGRLEAIYEELLKRSEARLTRKGVRPWEVVHPFTMAGQVVTAAA